MYNNDGDSRIKPSSTGVNLRGIKCNSMEGCKNPIDAALTKSNNKVIKKVGIFKRFSIGSVS